MCSAHHTAAALLATALTRERVTYKQPATLVLHPLSGGCDLSTVGTSFRDPAHLSTAAADYFSTSAGGTRSAVCRPGLTFWRVPRPSSNPPLSRLPERRLLRRLSVRDAAEADGLLTALMGPQVAPRKALIDEYSSRLASIALLDV
jgi:hypothetical protein